MLSADLDMPDVAAGCVLLSLTTIAADAAARSTSCEERFGERGGWEDGDRRQPDKTFMMLGSKIRSLLRLIATGNGNPTL